MLGQLPPELQKIQELVMKMQDPGMRETMAERLAQQGMPPPPPEGNPMEQLQQFSMDPRINQTVGSQSPPAEGAGGSVLPQVQAGPIAPPPTAQVPPAAGGGQPAALANAMAMQQIAGQVPQGSNPMAQPQPGPADIPPQMLQMMLQGGFR